MKLPRLLKRPPGIVAGTLHFIVSLVVIVAFFAVAIMEATKPRRAK